jgi:hypothetical protein
MVKPRDDRYVTQDLARDLADIAGQLASLKGEANSWLRNSNYNALKLRLESTHSALEAAAVEATAEFMMIDPHLRTRSEQTIPKHPAS